VLLLYKKQRKLKWLEAMDLDRDILPDLQKDERLQRSMFASARKLALYPENRTTLQLGEFLVTNLKGALEDLIVHCNFSFPEVSPSDSLLATYMHGDTVTGEQQYIGRPSVQLCPSPIAQFSHILIFS